MSKKIAIILCLCMFGVMALGSTSSDSESGKKEITTGSSDSGEKENSEDESKETASDDDSVNIAVENQNTKADVSIEEQIIFDKDGVKITAKEYEKDIIWGDKIKLLIENETDKDLTIGVDALMVNDYMISDLFVASVAAGKKANEDLHLYSSELTAAGIESVGKVELYFHAYDDNYDNIFKDEYALIKTSEFDNLDTEVDVVGAELYNEGGIKIVGKAVDEESFWGCAILLYCENNSGQNVSISVNDMSINGFMMTPFFSTTIYNEKKAIDSITILSSELKDNDIESIDEVELKFHIYNSDSWKTIVDTEPITFSAK